MDFLFLALIFGVVGLTLGVGALFEGFRSRRNSK